METFFANTLIFFLKSQRDLDYTGIEQLLDIIDDNNIPDENKREMLLAIMHRYGLNETSYKNGKFEPEWTNEKNDLIPKGIIQFHVQTFKIRSPDGVLKIMVPLN